MIASPDRLQIWASQLAANDFPPVCAMTGRPAETWRKFNFATPPQWAYALLVLICLGGIGIIAYAVVIATISQRASGYLPLTKSAKRTSDLVVWVPIGLIVAWLVLWVIGFATLPPSSDQSGSPLPGIFFGLGLLVLVAGLLGRLVITKLVAVTASVKEPQPGYTDKIVELRHVHPNFVQAVQQQHASRLAQSTSSN